MTQENRSKLKQVYSTENLKDDVAVFLLDNNNIGNDTDPPNGRGIEEISEVSFIEKSSRGNDIQGGPDTDPPNS